MHHVQDINLRGPGGEPLFLGRKVTTHCFFLPYSIVDDGFVLGVYGDGSSYYPFPNEQEVAKLQQQHRLPYPLPYWLMSTFDFLFGHLLWIGIAACVGVEYVRRGRGQP